MPLARFWRFFRGSALASGLIYSIDGVTWFQSTVLLTSFEFNGDIWHKRFCWGWKWFCWGSVHLAVPNHTNLMFWHCTSCLILRFCLWPSCKNNPLLQRLSSTSPYHHWDIKCTKLVSVPLLFLLNRIFAKIFFKLDMLLIICLGGLDSSVFKHFFKFSEFTLENKVWGRVNRCVIELNLMTAFQFIFI